MTYTHRLVAGLAGAVLLAAGFGVYRRVVNNAGRWAAERDAAVARADTLDRAVARMLDDLADIQDSVQALYHRERAATRAATTATARADALAAQRDAARARGVVAGDSVGWYRGQLTLAHEEVQALRIANALQADALAQATARATLLATAVDSGAKALASAHTLNRALTVQLRAAAPPCQFLWVACPSRTTATIVGAIGGAIVGGTLMKVVSDLQDNP